MRLRHGLAVLISVGLIAAPRAAFAHARLVRSAPAAGASVTSAPKMIQLWFSEAPDARLTIVTITAGDGRVAGLEKFEAVPDTAISVRAVIDGVLASGVYTVAWRTVAADDGHPSKGSFTFTVSAEVGVSMSTPPVKSGTVIGAAVNSAPTAAATAGLGVESPVYVIVRWLSFMGLVVVIGVIALRLLVLPRIGSAASEAFAVALIPRLATLGLAAAGLVIIAAIGRLFSEQSVMAASVHLGVADIVQHTTWGSVWLLQVGAAIVACAGLALARRHSAIGWGIGTVAVLVLAVTPALSGHAAGVENWRTLAIATDALHVIAAGAWLGSLCALIVVGVPTALRVEATGSDAAGGGRLVSEMVNAFSPIALVFASVVVLTGLVSAWLRLGSISALWSSSYGIVLIVKLALVGAVFAAGAFNWLRMREQLSKVDNADAHHRFQRSGKVELFFGVFVIAVTAVLVAMQTPLH
ncbi:MAG: CopD family protein [Gemmatimonadaceae bacterium]